MPIRVSVTIGLGASANFNDAEAAVLEAGRKAMLKALGKICREYERQVDSRPACGEKELSNLGTVLTQACVQAGSSWSYQTAARLLKEVCGAADQP